MRRTAGSFLNKLEYWMQLLSDEKTIEIRLCEKTELDGPAPYTHVLFRLVERIRKAGVQHHVMARLAGRLGPFSSARAAVEAAALAQRKLGLSEDDLLKYMTRMRKIQSGPLKGATEEVIVPVVLYLLDDIHARDDIWWRKCEHDQAGFLPYKHTPNGAAFSAVQAYAKGPHGCGDRSARGRALGPLAHEQDATAAGIAPLEAHVRFGGSGVVGADRPRSCGRGGGCSGWHRSARGAGAESAAPAVSLGGRY